MMAMSPIVDRVTYEAERCRLSIPPLGCEAAFCSIEELRAADLATAAARGLTHEPKADPKGIGRRAPSTPLDVALLIKTGALSDSPQPLCPHRQDWDWCPVCCR